MIYLMMSFLKKIHDKFSGYRTFILGIGFVFLGQKVDNGNLTALGVAMLLARYSVSFQKNKEDEQRKP